MISSTIPSVAATATILLPLTTPFAPPQNSDCAISDLTSITASYRGDNSTHTALIVYSDPADVRFASCQPPGWEAAVPESRFSFSPAVCPSRWNAFGISMSHSARKTVTRAFCCAPGYELSKVQTQLAVEQRQCAQLIDQRVSTTVYATLSHGNGDVKAVTKGEMMHPAWTIIWESSDQAMMTPRPPDMKWGIYVPEWVPGSPIDVDSYSDAPSNNGESGLKGLGHSIFWLLVIGLPLICLTATAGGVWCCCRHIKKRKLRLAAASEAVRNAEAMINAEAVRSAEPVKR